MTSFTTLLWTTTSEVLPRIYWAERMLVAFRALQEHAGVERFWTVGFEPQQISLEPAAIEDLITATQSTDDVGQPHPGLGSTFGVLCTGPDGDPSRPRFRVGFTVDSTPKNRLSVSFDPETSADAARAVLEACVPAWSPSWGCVESETNSKARQDEFDQTLAPEDDGLLVPISSLLHWVTYFGPERAAEIDVTVVEGRSDVTVRSLHDGLEIVLGEQWDSDAALRDRQRELEPLILGKRAQTDA